MAKITSIRADEQTLEKFKELSDQFSNQGDCLNQLITAYEISNAKYILTDVKADVADYQSHIDSIQQAFLHILDINANTETRIRQEFRQQMDSKDNVIMELQEQVRQLKETSDKIIVECEATTSKAVDRAGQLEKDLEALQAKLQLSETNLIEKIKILTDKEIIIENLTLRLPEQSVMEEKIKQLEASINEKDTSLANIEQKFEDVTKQLNDTISKNKYEKDIIKQQAELELRQAIIAEKEKSQSHFEEQAKKIERLNEQVLSLNKKILELQFAQK